MSRYKSRRWEMEVTRSKMKWRSTVLTQKKEVEGDDWHDYPLDDLQEQNWKGLVWSKKENCRQTTFFFLTFPLFFTPTPTLGSSLSYRHSYIWISLYHLFNNKHLNYHIRPSSCVFSEPKHPGDIFCDSEHTHPHPPHSQAPYVLIVVKSLDTSRNAHILSLMYSMKSWFIRSMTRQDTRRQRTWVLVIVRSVQSVVVGVCMLCTSRLTIKLVRLIVLSKSILGWFLHVSLTPMEVSLIVIINQVWAWLSLIIKPFSPLLSQPFQVCPWFTGPKRWQDKNVI